MSIRQKTGAGSKSSIINFSVFVYFCYIYWASLPFPSINCAIIAAAILLMLNSCKFSSAQTFWLRNYKHIFRKCCSVLQRQLRNLACRVSARFEPQLSMLWFWQAYLIFIYLVHQLAQTTMYNLVPGGNELGSNTEIPKLSPITSVLDFSLKTL